MSIWEILAGICFTCATVWAEVQRRKERRERKRKQEELENELERAREREKHAKIDAYSLAKIMRQYANEHPDDKIYCMIQARGFKIRIIRNVAMEIKRDRKEQGLATMSDRIAKMTDERPTEAT